MSAIDNARAGARQQTRERIATLERERDELAAEVARLLDFLRRVKAADALEPIVDGTRDFEYDLMQGFSDELRALLAGGEGEERNQG